MCQFWDNLMKVKCQWLQKSVESCSRRPATYTAAFDPATMVVRYDMCRVWHGMTQMVHDTPDPLAKLDWVDRHRPLLSTWPVNVPMRQLPRPSLWIILKLYRKKAAKINQWFSWACHLSTIIYFLLTLPIVKAFGAWGHVDMNTHRGSSWRARLLRFRLYSCRRTRMKETYLRQVVLQPRHRYSIEVRCWNFKGCK